MIEKQVGRQRTKYVKRREQSRRVVGCFEREERRRVDVSETERRRKQKSTVGLTEST